MKEQKAKKAGICAYIASPLLTAVLMLLASALFFSIFRNIGMVIFFLIILVIDLVCKLLFAFLPRPKKSVARYASMIAFSFLTFFAAGILGQQNFQLEGFLFFVFAGVFGGVTVHFINAKIVGPFLQGRSWCGWGCWTTMVLDLLPYKRSPGRKVGSIGFIRYFHLAMVAAIIALLVFAGGYTIHNPAPTPEYQGSIQALYWFAIGNGLYYFLGVTLAIVFKDNRAFCKYVCPVSLLLKIFASPSLLKISGKKELCDQCGRCKHSCIMDIDIPAYIHSGQRVTSNECVLCLKCIAECPNAALSASVGLDISKKNYLCNQSQSPSANRVLGERK